jgi:hypothetical protein
LKMHRRDAMHSDGPAGDRVRRPSQDQYRDENRRRVTETLCRRWSGASIIQVGMPKCAYSGISYRTRHLPLGQNRGL